MKTKQDLKDFQAHMRHFGSEAVVHKSTRGWNVSWRGWIHPQYFKTKKDAVQAACDMELINPNDYPDGD